MERRFIFSNYVNSSLKNVNDFLQAILNRASERTVWPGSDVSTPDRFQNFKINLSGPAGSHPYGQDTIEPVFEAIQCVLDWIISSGKAHFVIGDFPGPAPPPPELWQVPRAGGPLRPADLFFENANGSNGPTILKEFLRLLRRLQNKKRSIPVGAAKYVDPERYPAGPAGLRQCACRRQPSREIWDPRAALLYWR